jgi:hypothetical protein
VLIDLSPSCPPLRWQRGGGKVEGMYLVEILAQGFYYGKGFLSLLRKNKNSLNPSLRKRETRKGMKVEAINTLYYLM